MHFIFKLVYYLLIMTPFSKLLLDIRQQRGLRQNQMANLLGFEQSYLSALECGHKAPPKKDKLDHLIQKLELKDPDACELRLAAKASAKTIKIPNKVKVQTQEMCRLLEEVLPEISDKQVQIIKLALELSARKEAPKM